MIFYPDYWKKIGIKINYQEIIEAIKKVLLKINCYNLALSGGVDSTIMLSLMIDVYGKENINCFNITCSSNHPDYKYSEFVARKFNVNLIHWIPIRKLKKEQNDFEGDQNVREFFRWLVEKQINSIITCDGIDEFMGGYYDHMKNPIEETYYNYIRRLQKEQLEPLDKNSVGVKVFLPYIDKSIIFLLSQIPYSEKFDQNERKKVMNEIAKLREIPEEIITRHKYGFIDAMKIKE